MMTKLFGTLFPIMVFLFTCFVQEGYARKKKEKVKDVKKSAYEKLFQGKACETVSGLFTIHKMEGKVYFEIPLNLLGKDMLLGSTIVETTNNLFGSVGEKPADPLCVVFTKTDSVISLRQLHFNCITSLDNVAQRIRESTRPAVLNNFSILAYRPDSTAVVLDVTDFFLKDDERLSPFSEYAPILWGGNWMEKDFKKEKSQMGKVKAFSDNVSVQISLSYDVNVRDAQYYYIYKLPFTSLISRSFMLLPEHPMRPRLADPRIGIFNTEKSDFRNGDTGMKTVYYANRWRLEPSDNVAYANGELVEPKKPIVFYVDDAFPESWKKYIKAGVEEWQHAFEKIGFKNAIYTKDFPKDDPEFDPDNVKYTCVRYSPSVVANAMGPSWTDPRTGEIINASVYLYHNLVQLVHDWRFLQTAPADSDVRKVVFDEETLGRCIQYVVTHEVGHCLSLMHNMSGSAAIPTDSLRSPSFTQKYGTTYSIMDYARNNYVAQPGDKERGVKLTPPALGLYDLYAIRWLYTPILDAKTSQDEVPTLNRWISEKAGDPIYRYGKQQIYSHIDPSSFEEDLGDDAIKSATYGVKNLKYILTHLNDWVAAEDVDLSFRQGMYNEVIYQYVRYVNHVLYNIGGIYLNERYDGDKLPSYSVVAKEKQVGALHFLLDQIRDLSWLNAPEIQKRLPLTNTISTTLENNIFEAVLSRVAAVALSATKEENENRYTSREFWKNMQDFVFAPTREGKTLTPQEKNFQMKFLTNMMLFSGISKKGMEGNPMAWNDIYKKVDVPEEVKTISRQRYGRLSECMLGIFTNQESVKACRQATCEKDYMPLGNPEIEGFSYWVNVNMQENIEPLEHLYFDTMRKTLALLKSKANTGSEDTRQHYKLLIFKIEQAIK